MKNSKMAFMVIAGFSMGLVAQDDVSIVNKATEAMKSASNKVVAFANSTADVLDAKALVAGQAVKETLTTVGTKAAEVAKSAADTVVTTASAAGNALKESFITGVEQEDAADKAKAHVSADEVKNTINTIKKAIAPEVAPVVKEVTTPVAAPTFFERTKDYTVKSVNQACAYTKENPVFVGSIATATVLTVAAVTYYVYQSSAVDNDTATSNN